MTKVVLTAQFADAHLADGFAWPAVEQVEEVRCCYWGQSMKGREDRVCKRVHAPSTEVQQSCAVAVVQQSFCCCAGFGLNRMVSTVV